MGEAEAEAQAQAQGGDLRHQEDTREKVAAVRVLFCEHLQRGLLEQMMMMLTFGQLPPLPPLPPLPASLTAYEIFTVCLPGSAVRYATIFYAVSATSCCKLKMQAGDAGGRGLQLDAVPAAPDPINCLHKTQMARQI